MLVATEAPWVRDEIHASLTKPGWRVVDVDSGFNVRASVAFEKPNLVICDMQIGNMGGIAVTHDLRLEESGGRLGRVPILLLLDREADRFLAKRCGADGALLKPIDAATYRKTADRMINVFGARPL